MFTESIILDHSSSSSSVGQHSEVLAI